MLPVENGKGKIWRGDQFLCDVEYDIGEPLENTDGAQVQRILFNLPDEKSASLLDAYDLTLVSASGSRYAIPRPIQHADRSYLECYVESLA